MIQAVVCTKYLEKLKYKLLNEKDLSGVNVVKDVKVIFGGDFNSDPPSNAFSKYIETFIWNNLFLISNWFSF